MSLHGLLLAEPHIDSGAKAKVVLAVIEAVGDFGHEVLGLRGTNGNVPGDFDIDAAASGHGKIIFGRRLANSFGCPNASQESLDGQATILEFLPSPARPYALLVSP